MRRIYKHKDDRWIIHNYSQMVAIADRFRIDAENPVDDDSRVGFWEEFGNLNTEILLRNLENVAPKLSWLK